MRNRARVACSTLLGIVLATAPLAASAVPPVGSWDVWFGGSESIWIPDDVTDACEGLEGQLEAEGFTLLNCTTSARTDARGRIAGALELSADGQGVRVDLQGDIRGKVRGDSRRGISTIQLKIRLSGLATDLVNSVPFKLDSTVRAEVASDGSVSGLARVRACARGIGCVRGVEGFTDLASDGDWHLELVITDLGNGRLGGTASVELGSGLTCAYEIIGRYSDRRDEANLKLRPEPACSGSKIQLRRVRNSGPLAAEVSYSVAGHKGKRVPVSATQAASP